ncbi:MAG: hypothetical protein E7503_01060 [Ruminococcus sp.]|nr:hypothetical protein [Ruminococcus sp.]
MKSATIRKMENHARQVVRNVAICFAVLMGIVALYYCLLPALAENASETDVYVFFDNGLSKYEGKTTDGVKTVVVGSVYSSESDYSADATLEMKLLADVISENGAHWNAVKAQLGDAVKGDGTITNINPANVYVSTATVRVGNYITFSAWDSGTVYDTMANYRVNAASREWGYDYVDFQWVSPKTAMTYGNNCYYAPPQLMINRYAAEAAIYSGGPKALRQMIYQHGDTYNTTEYYDANGDGTIDTNAGDINIQLNASSKPEVNGAWANPQNAYGRTFYDAVLDMKGKFGAPTDVNDLAANSQSANGVTREGSVALNGNGDNGLRDANTIYHATATFFDYFSDWELAGNPLAEHITSYTHDSEDGKAKEELFALNQTVSDGMVVLTENFDNAEDMLVFTNVSDKANSNVNVRDNANDTHTADGSHFLQIYARGIAEYKLPADATGDVFSSSVWVRQAHNKTDTLTVSLYYELNGTAHTITLNEFAYTGWSNWTLLETGLFSVPDGATNAALRYSSVNTYRLDDFTLKYESSGRNVTTTTYNWEQKTLIDFEDSTKANPSDYGFSLINTGWEPNVNDIPEGYGAYLTLSNTLEDAWELTPDSNKLLNVWHNPLVYNTGVLSAGKYRLTVDVQEVCVWNTDNNGLDEWGLGSVYIYITTDGGATLVPIASQTGISGKSDGIGTATLTGEFTLDADADALLCFQTFPGPYIEWNTSMGTDSCYYDNIKLEYEQATTVTNWVNGEEVTLTVDAKENNNAQDDYAKQLGITLSSKSDVENRKGMELFLNIADTKDSNDDGITKNGNVVPQGSGAYSNKENYLIEGNAFATGAVKLVAKHYHQYFDGSVTAANRKMEFVSEEVLAEYAAGSIFISEYFAPPIGANATRLSLVAVESGTEILISHIDVSKALLNTNGTFSEGTNRIAYSYQGLSFNDAISRYYVAAGADANSVVPLYFGSNSWMTGNLRYYLGDRKNQPLFTADEVQKALEYIGVESLLTRDDYINTQYGDTPIKSDNGKDTYVGAYLIPLSREYWINLFGYGLTYPGDTSGVVANGNSLIYNRNPNWETDNEPLGGSNSRGVENLVIYNPDLDIITLANTAQTLEAPYFNTDFLRGENPDNAVYGDVYENVDFAFAYNEDSEYYEFDSTKAWYAVRLTQNGTTGKYYMDYYNYSQLVDHYDGSTTGNVVSYAADSTIRYPGVTKADGSWGDSNGSSQTLYQFLPFNSPATNDRFATENLMFGMKLDIPFNMAKTLTYNGDQLATTTTSNSMFKFSGDDDVWVYVDGQKVLDIGGTHTAVGGFIDLKNGYGVLGSTYADYTGVWENSSDLSTLAPALTSGKDQAIVSLEKAAFAALASLEELELVRDDVNSLGVGQATAWIGNTEQVHEEVDFFDDAYTFATAGGSVGYFQYRARLVKAGEYVIDINIPNKINGSMNGGTVTFDLSVFTMTENDDNTTSTTIIDGNEKFEYQIIDHELTIYYMERGLNSSNFKLAFNFVPNADREVEKSWGDGADAHTDDAILVALYGADPGEASGKFNLLDTDYSLLRLIGHTALENSSNDLMSSGFIGDQDKVSVRFQLDDANINSAAALSINGMPITEEVYKQLHNSAMGLTIYVDNNEVLIDEDDNYVGFEFFDPKDAADKHSYNAAGFETQYCTNDWGTGKNVTDAQKHSAIKLHDTATDSGTVIKIEFNQVDVTNNMPEPENGVNGWGFFNTSAWLIEAFGWDVDNNTAVPVLSRGITTASESTVHATDRKSGNARTLNASDMLIYITNVLRERNNSAIAEENGTTTLYIQAPNVTANAVVPGDEMTLNYNESKSRKPLLGVGRWTNIFKFDAENYTIDATYNGKADHSFPHVLKTFTAAGDARATMIVLGGGESLNQALNLEDVVYDTTFAVTDFGYSEPKLYGDGNFDWDGDGQPDVGVYLLDEASDWLALWEGLPSAKNINNADYKYQYFIRELAILEKNDQGKYVTKTDANYRTTYYADYVAEGNEITPVYFKINDETVGLYSLDTDEGKVVISNEEVTKATITKAWAGVDNSEKIEVLVDVYVEDPAIPGVITLYDTVTIGPDNNWAVTLEDMLVYNNNETNPQKLIYYAAEEALEDFTATYNGVRVTKTYGGSQLVVYQLNTVTTADPVTGEDKDSYALTVTNQKSGFVLEVDKFDEDGTTPLEGATFILYEWTGEGNPNDYLDANGKKSWDTDGDGLWSAEEIMANVGFGLWVPVSDGEETETESVTPQNEDKTASVETPRSRKVLNKVVQTATATVSQVNGSTTYTTVKKVGAIAATEITSDISVNFANTTSSAYFDLAIKASQKSDNPLTYNGTTYSKALSIGSGQSLSFIIPENYTATVTMLMRMRYVDKTATIAFDGGDPIPVPLYDDDNCVITVELTAGSHSFTRVSGAEILLYYIAVDVEPVGTTASSQGGETTTTTTTMTAQQTLMSAASLVINGNPGNNNYVQGTQFVYYQAEGNNIQSNGNLKSLNFNTHEQSLTIDGNTYKTKGVKMQGQTRIGFSIGIKGTLYVYVNGQNGAGNINITSLSTGRVYSSAVSASGTTGVEVLTFELEEFGEYSIAKGDGAQFFVEAIYFGPPQVRLPFDNATDAELMMDLINNNKLRYDSNDPGEYVDPEEWYKSELATLTAYKLIEYQIKVPYAGIGGWTKEQGNGTPFPPTNNNWGQGTIDNEITCAQIRFLSKVYQATGNTDFYDSLIKGIEFILGDAYVGEYYKDNKGGINSGQQKDTGLRYANGGFAQRFDESESAYHHQITFNDNAMVNVLRILSEIGTASGDFSFLTVKNPELAKEALDAVHQGVQCILDCQIIVNNNASDYQFQYTYKDKYVNGDGTITSRVNIPVATDKWHGRYTGWCQQHDPQTLEPGWARAFEPPSISAGESVNVITYLIEYYNSSICTPELKAVLPRRINAAVDWISSEDIKLHVELITGTETYVKDKDGNTTTNSNSRMYLQASDTSVLWARFYSVMDGVTPLWCDRDWSDSKTDSFLDNFRDSYANMTGERRNGYNYAQTSPNSIASNPDAYRIPIDGTTVKDLIVYPSKPISNASSVVAKGWYDYGDAWAIIGSIKNQELVYGDETYVFSNLPNALIGCEYIRPANASSAKNAANALGTFRLSKAANLYIPVPNGTNLPAEMSGWTKTTVTITVNNTTMTIYSKALAPNADAAEPYSLYSLANAGVLNYGVFIAVGSEDATRYTTDAKGEVSIAGLKADTYYAIIEIAAPIGYLPLDKPALFSVFTVKEGEQMGTIDQTKDPEVIDKTGYVQMEWDSDKALALDADILNDSTHVELPNTGASPISILLRGIAALLPVLAGVHFVWKRMVCPVE